MAETNVTIRSYQGGDEAPIIDCWNQCLPYDTITESVFIRKVLCDANFNPEGLLVAEGPGGEIVGFILAIVRQVPVFGDNLDKEVGWITTFGVKPTWQRQHIATQLYHAAERFLQQRGRSTVFFASYSPHYFLPGIDAEHYPAGAAFLESIGFGKVYPCVAMDVSVPLFTIPSDVRNLQYQREAEGYRFVSLSPEYLTDTLQLVKEHFSPDWNRAIRAAVARGVPFGNFLIVTNPNDQVVGFCMFGGYDHSPDRFGPFGVVESERGKGLGKVLLYLCLDTMRAQGLHDAWFLWTGENSPAGILYKRAGFTITRRFAVMKKQLKQG